MHTQCCICKRIQDGDDFRLPWPGELGHTVIDTYCPRCANDTLERIQDGEFARLANRRATQRAARHSSRA